MLGGLGPSGAQQPDHLRHRVKNRTTGLDPGEPVLYCALRGQPSNVAQGRVLLSPAGGAGLPVLRSKPHLACAFRANWPARSEATQPASSWASGRGAREPWAQEGAKRRLHPQRRRRQHLPCTATSQGSKTNRAARRQPDVFSAEARSPIAEARPSLPPPARPLPASERWQHHRSPCPARPAE